LDVYSLIARILTILVILIVESASTSPLFSHEIAQGAGWSHPGGVTSSAENAPPHAAAPTWLRNRFKSGADDAFDNEAWCEEIGHRLEPFYGCTVDTIIVVGNTRTRRETIVREMATREGAPLDEELIRRDTTYLRGLGYFSEVDICAARTATGGCLITVTITERPNLFMKYPYPVINYDFTDGVSYGFRWTIKNFRGHGEHLSISVLKRRDLDHGGGISWNVPWVGGQRLRFDTHLYTFRKLEEPESEDFIKVRNGGSLNIGIPITKNLVKQVWISSILSFERRESRLSRGDNISADADYYQQNIVSTGLQLSYDSRDNVLAAFRGVFGRYSIVRNTAVYGLAQQYTFYHFENHIYIPLRWLGSLILAFDGDFRDGDLPEFFRMDLGGRNSLRGYDRSGKGTAKLIQSLQLRKRILEPYIFDIPHIGKFDITMNAIVFVDNGALSDDITDFDGSRFHTTGGFGFEILSPIQDILRFEVAIAGKGEAAFYLISGARF